MQKQEKKFFEGHRSTFWIKMTFGIGHPPPIHQLQSICVGEGSRVPNLQTEFNYLDSFKSYGIFSDFVVPVVPTLSLSSPHHPCHPHVVPVIPTSSPCHPHHPHIIPIAPKRSACGPHGCGLHCLCGLHPMLSPWSPCCPRCPHVIPIIPTSSPCHPRHPHIIPIAPRRSLCGPHGCSLRCLRGLHPMLSPWSPHCPDHPHVIPMLSLSSPHHLEGPHIIANPSDTHSTHPHPLGGWGAPNQ